MKLRDFIPPAVMAFAGSVVRSFAADFIRGRDADDDLSGARTAFVAPYRQSAWVRAAVHHVAGEISGRPLRFYAGEAEFAEAALAAWWAAPALGPRTLSGRPPRLTLAETLRDLAAWERLEGEFFLVLDDSWLLARPSALSSRLSTLPPFLIAHPQRMQAIVQAGVLTGWRYVDAGGRQLTLVPEQVIHHRSFNPYDDWRGVGCLAAARVAAEGAFLTGAYIRDLARNNGDQGMVVVAKGGVVSDAQREQILRDLRAKRAALNRGVAKDLLLGGDITIDRPKEQAASADLTASQALSHQEIFVAFDVPPSMAEVKQSYSIGKDSDRYQLITGTCQPLGHRIAAALAAVGSRQTGRELTAELEWDDHPVMIEVRNSRLESALKLWGVGMPIKDANDYLGLGMKPFAGWEQGYLPFSVAPVSDSQLSALSSQPATDPATDPTLAEPAAADPAVEQLRLLLLARARTAARPVCKIENPESKIENHFACTCEVGGRVPAPAFQEKRSAREVAQWRTLMTQRRETVRSFQSGLGRVLMAARAETLRKIEGAQKLRAQSPELRAGLTESGSQPSALGSQLSAKATAADLLFDLAKFADAFTATVRARQKTALKTAGQQLLAELGKDDAFAYPPEKVLDFLASRANKLADTPTAIFEEVKAAIEEGLKAGDSTADLAARVRAAFNEISDARAFTIAMTETSAAYGAGRDEAMVQAGVQWKRWLTSGNANVRAAHAEANGQIVALDEAFTVGGEALAYPGDDSGSAENVINCHCVSIASAEGPDTAA